MFGQWLSFSDRACLCELEGNRCWLDGYMLGIDGVNASAMVIGVVSAFK